MKHWRRLVVGVTLGLAAGLPAHAETCPSAGNIFCITDGVTGDDLQIKTYLFDVSVPATYIVSLADLKFLDSFDSLALGVARNGSTTPVLDSVTLDSTKATGSFDFFASPGRYVLLLFGDPGPLKGGSYSINVNAVGPVATAVPEPAAWLMMGVGALLVGFVRLRGRVQ